MALSSEFTNNEAFLNFQFKNNQYNVEIIRDSLFTGYKYNVTKRNLHILEGEDLSKYSEVYDSPVMIDDEVYCVVSD